MTAVDSRAYDLLVVRDALVLDGYPFASLELAEIVWTRASKEQGSAWLSTDGLTIAQVQKHLWPVIDAMINEDLAAFEKGL